MRRYLSLLTLSIALAACSSAAHRPQFSRGDPVYDCPEQLAGQVGLQADIRPVALHGPPMRETSIATTGSVGRRIVIAVIPAGLRPDDRIVWSTLTISSLGGTFLGWDALQTSSGATSPRSDAERAGASRRTFDERLEVATVTLASGQLKLARVARGRTDLAGMYSIDVLLMPGGVVVDDTMVHIPKLWHENGTPLSPAEVTPQLVPVRHPPGLDVVQATFHLDFVVRLGAGGDEWTCSAETRATLVDTDALRQPFWDLGLASANALRREWLALFDPALGGIRLVFDSPARASALAEWIRATRSSRLGPYGIGAFQQATLLERRPFGTVEEEKLQTFRPLTDRDIDAIVVGPVGEP